MSLIKKTIDFVMDKCIPRNQIVYPQSITSAERALIFRVFVFYNDISAIPVFDDFLT
jgi:hypothetical protein